MGEPFTDWERDWLGQFRRPLILYPPGQDPNPPLRDVWRAVINGKDLEEWVLGTIYEDANGKETLVWFRDKPKPLSRWEKIRLWLRPKPNDAP